VAAARVVLAEAETAALAIVAARLPRTTTAAVAGLAAVGQGFGALRIITAGVVVGIAGGTQGEAGRLAVAIDALGARSTRCAVILWFLYALAVGLATHPIVARITEMAAIDARAGRADPVLATVAGRATVVVGVAARAVALGPLDARAVGSADPVVAFVILH
jgi:hypothetical protein